jgi:hypothetical protein
MPPGSRGDNGYFPVRAPRDLIGSVAANSDWIALGMNTSIAANLAHLSAVFSRLAECPQDPVLRLRLHSCSFEIRRECVCVTLRKK